MNDWVNTKVAMQMLGVGSTTIKRWANEKKLRHIRTAGGHRRFSRADIERFLEQESASGTAVSPDKWIAQLVETGSPGVIHDQIVQSYARLGDWFDVADTLGHIVEQIGVRWATGEISVVQEHIATSRLSRALDAVSSSFWLQRPAPVCLLATLTGEQHALGLSLTQLCLRAVGVDVLWVGVNTPADELVSHVRASGPDMVGLSASRWSTDRGYLAAAYRDIATVCRDQGIGLILGGAGAWPDTIDYGHRCHSFKDLRRVLARSGPEEVAQYGSQG